MRKWGPYHLKQHGSEKKILVSYADKILNALLAKYTQKHIRVPIQKYFQNNGAKFEFKI